MCEREEFVQGTFPTPSLFRGYLELQIEQHQPDRHARSCSTVQVACVQPWRRVTSKRWVTSTSIR